MLKLIGDLPPLFLWIMISFKKIFGVYQRNSSQLLPNLTALPLFRQRRAKKFWLFFYQKDLFFFYRKKGRRVNTAPLLFQNFCWKGGGGSWLEFCWLQSTGNIWCDSSWAQTFSKWSLLFFSESTGGGRRAPSFSSPWDISGAHWGAVGPQFRESSQDISGVLKSPR